VGVWIVSCRASAEKRITVKLTHSPALAEASSTRITLGAISGDCAKEFGDLLQQDLRAHKVSTAQSDPAAVLSVDVTRCEAHTMPPILGEGLPAMHISRTEGFFLASIRAVDPMSGRTLAAVIVRGHAQKENESQTLNPEYPAPAEVKSMALRQGLADARHLYAPWIESRELPFADNKECHLKQAYEVARAGDYEALVHLSRANVYSCVAGSKAAMEAWYDLGVASMLVGKYDDAVAAFEKAVQLNGAKLVAGLVDECSQESAALKARHPLPPPASPAETVQTGIIMTNDLVIRLIDGNVTEQEVLKMIANQPGRFSLQPGDLARLKDAGVPDSVVAAMRNKK
jgi:hypothetical protein